MYQAKAHTWDTWTSGLVRKTGRLGPITGLCLHRLLRDADRDELEDARGTRGLSWGARATEARAWHCLACLARNLKPADRGMGDGWQRPEASEKQVRPTAKLAQQKSKYLSLSHSLLPLSARPTLPRCLSVCLPRLSVWPGR